MILFIEITAVVNNIWKVENKSHAERSLQISFLKSTWMISANEQQEST